jgi:hypothetical protein
MLLLAAFHRVFVVCYHPKITTPKLKKMNIATKAPAANAEPWANSL